MRRYTPAMHTRLASCLLASLFILPSSAALAQNHSLVASPPPPAERRNEVNIGLIVGGYDIGDSKRFTRGLQASVGRRFGDVALLAEYQYLAVGRDDSASRGSLSRIGATARYSLIRTKTLPHNRRKHSAASGDVWFESGLGISRLTWESGGVLTRPDLAFGIGAQLDKVIDRRADRPRLFGPYVAFRAHVARSPVEASGMPTCGGPCDKPTHPSRNNVGLFFHFGFNWGR